MSDSVNIIVSEIGGQENKGKAILNSYQRSVDISWDCSAVAPLISVPVTDFPEEVIKKIRGWYCTFAITVPGGHTKYPGIAPSAHNIVIKDEYGVSIFGGGLDNRSTVESEQAVPAIGSGLGSRLCFGTWTFEIENNTVENAVGFTRIFFEV